jgi:hypothetical protein
MSSKNALYKSWSHEHMARFVFESLHTELIEDDPTVGISHKKMTQLEEDIVSIYMKTFTKKQMLYILENLIQFGLEPEPNYEGKL